MLDYSRQQAFLDRHFASGTERRLVGRRRRSDCGYDGIVRFFGPQRIDPFTVRLAYLPGTFNLADPLIAEFAADVEAILRTQGRLTSGPPVMKAVSFSAEPGKLSVQATDYGQFAGSCFALDLEHRLFAPYGGTLRDYYRSAHTIDGLHGNPLAICLGVAGLLIVRESSQRWALRVRRSARLASLAGSYGPSAAGVVDFETGLVDLDAVVRSAMAREVEEELLLVSTEYSITPLAWALELFRGEHPQLFCLIETSLDRAAVLARLEHLDEAAREFSAAEFVELESGAVSDDLFASLNFEAQMTCALVDEYFNL